MKATVRRLFIVQLVILALASLGSVLLWGVPGLAAVVGALAFSVPLAVFSQMVLRASSGEPSRFLGRFVAAEALKWAGAALLLTLAFVSRAFEPVPLIAGFFLSVVAQLFFPIFLPPKASES